MTMIVPDWIVEAYPTYFVLVGPRWRSGKPTAFSVCRYARDDRGCWVEVLVKRFPTRGRKGWRAMFDARVLCRDLNLLEG